MLGALAVASGSSRAVKASEMDAPDLSGLALPPAVVPEGAPVTRRVEVGEALATVVASLPAGSHLVLAPGAHHGPLIIDRPLEVSGESGATLTGEGRGSVLVIAADDVRVHDLTVVGSGHLSEDDDAGVVIAGDRFDIERVNVDRAYLGFDFRGADDGILRDSSVTGLASAPFGERGDGLRLWESNRNLVSGNTLTNVRDLVVWYANDNTITGNHVVGSRYGTHLMHTKGNRIESNTYTSDVVGVFCMYSDSVVVRRNVVTGALGEAGVGVGFKESDGVVVEANLLIGNTTGMYLDTTPQRTDTPSSFRDNLVAQNDVGIRFHGPRYGGVFEHNAFEDNRQAVAIDGGGDVLGSAFRQNHWSDYAGYDLDGDGVGDVSYAPRSFAQDLWDRRPALAYFTGTPAQTLLELFGQAFPMFLPKPLLRDESPLVDWSLP